MRWLLRRLSSSTSGNIYLECIEFWLCSDSGKLTDSHRTFLIFYSSNIVTTSTKVSGSQTPTVWLYCIPLVRKELYTSY